MNSFGEEGGRISSDYRSNVSSNMKYIEDKIK